MSSSTYLRLISALRVTAFLAAYVLAGLAGRYIPFLSGRESVTLLWLPSGIALASMLLLGWRHFAVIPTGMVFFAIADKLPPALLVTGAIGNTVTALLGAYLLKHFFDFDRALERTPRVAGFLFVACGFCAPLNAAAFTVGLALTHKITWDAFSENLPGVWISDMPGVLIGASLIVTWSARSSIWMNWLRLLEAAAGVTGLFASSLLAFDLRVIPALQPYPVTYLPYLFLVWSALRFGPRGAATGTLIVAGLATYSLWRHQGPFATGNDMDSLRMLGTFFSLMAITTLLLGAAAMERRRRLNDIYQGERRLLAVIADQPDLICRFDPNGKISFVNASFCRFYGQEEDRLLGTDYFQTLEEIEAKKLRENLSSLPDENPVLSFDRRTAAADGRIEWHQCIFRRLRRDGWGGFEYQAVMQDITQRKRAELAERAVRGELEKANQQLELAAAEAREAAAKANRASNAKSEFLTIMSHELRTPLSGIIGMMDLLAQTRLDKRQHEFATGAVDSANALLRVINDVLDFSKIEAGKLSLAREEFSLRSVVDSVLENAVPREAGKKITLAALIRREIPRRLIGDPARLGRILLNLTSNGVKFTARGEVVVRVLPLIYGPGKITLRFEVADTGPGLTSDEIKRLFQPFTQVDTSSARKFGGTGLGLAISRKLAELMDGKIGVFSTPGQGSTFWFELPFDVPPNPVIERSFPGLVFLHVLVATENTSLGEALVEQLHGWGVDGHAVATPAALAHTLRNDLGAMVMPLVLCDDDLIEAGGGELRQLLAETRPRVPCLLLAKPGSSLAGDEAGPAGFTNVLLKPVREQPLFNALVTAILSIRPVSPESVKAKSGNTEFTARLRPKPKRTALTGLKVLGGDDHPFNRKLCQLVLENLGVTAEWAVNGHEAVEKFVPGVTDAILMDCNMPELDGYDATAAIRKIEAEKNPARRVRIIALTANVMTGERERCLAAGMDDYIPKPFTAQQIYHALLAAVPPPAHDAEFFNSARLEQLCDEIGHTPVRDMASDFVAELPGRLAEMKRFEEEKNWGELVHAAQSLKSLAAVFGLQKLSDAFLAIKDGGGANDALAIRDAFNGIDQLADSAAQQLREWLDNNYDPYQP
ncbi:MAG: MASE1 domain-containing protein [Verrucomicrobia bacterium]|nr:MASE1 domain-containing protein [Verrucomicrobiota bacterium]